MRKLVLPAVLIIVLLSSGCLSLDPTTLVKASPAVSKFLEEYPNAEVKVTHYTAEESEAIVEKIMTDCEKEAVSPKEYYKVTITDDESDLDVVAWVDVGNQLVECVVKKGSDGDEPIPEYHECTDEQRDKDCDEEYEPVCAQVDTGIRCVTEPCPATKWKTYGNACTACSNPTTLGWKEGACEEACQSNYKVKCYGGHVYWYDSCGNREGKKEYCPLGCSNDACIKDNRICEVDKDYTEKPDCVCPEGYEMIVAYPACQTSPSGALVGITGMFITGMPFVESEGTMELDSSYTTDPGMSCGTKSIYRCVKKEQCRSMYKTGCYNGHVYWFDSCGNVEAKREYCENGCSGGACISFSYDGFDEGIFVPVSAELKTWEKEGEPQFTLRLATAEGREYEVREGGNAAMRLRLYEGQWQGASCTNVRTSEIVEDVSSPESNTPRVFYLMEARGCNFNLEEGDEHTIMVDLYYHEDAGAEDWKIASGTVTLPATAYPDDYRYHCSDTDDSELYPKGFNYMQKGTVYEYVDDLIDPKNTYTDTCVDEMTLKEYACYGGRMTSTVFPCFADSSRSVCKDGACVTAEACNKNDVCEKGEDDSCPDCIFAPGWRCDHDDVCEKGEPDRECDDCNFAGEWSCNHDGICGPEEPVRECDDCTEGGDYCTDSDGNNYFEKGTVEYVYEGRPKMVETDYCGQGEIEGRVVEYTCNQFGTSNGEDVLCEYGCEDGACLMQNKTVCCESYGYGAGMVECCWEHEWMDFNECQVPDDLVGGGKRVVDGSYCYTGSCNDTDGGYDIYEAGTATDSDTNMSRSDYCNEDGTITEQFCKGGDIRAALVECPQGYVCEDAECVYTS